MWLIESTRPRGFYPLACVTSLNYGKANVARSANLMTVSRNYTTSLVTLVTLVVVLTPSGQLEQKASTKDPNKAAYFSD